MKLLITTDAVGGVWSYSLDLARALGARGVEIVLTVLGPRPSEDKRAAVHDLQGVALIETDLALDWLCDGPDEVHRAAARIADLARAERVDLVHLHSPTLAGGAAYPVPVVAVTHGCVSTWWAAARSTPLDPHYRWHHALVAKGLAQADSVIAPSAAYAETVARHYALTFPPDAVYNGRALAPHAARPQHDAAITVGRLWDTVKNAALLDRAAAELAVPFYAAGASTGPHGETIALSELIVLGELSPAALAARLAAQPVFVSAARFEPFGLAVLEAAGAGCALVLADIATFRELWDGVALFVPPDDAPGYAEAIAALIGDPALRRQLGAAARERAARYTVDRMAEAMLRRYRDLLAMPMKAVAA